MDTNIARKIIRNCLNGQLVPSGLEKLWLAATQGGDDLRIKQTDEWLRSIGLPVENVGQIGASRQILAALRNHITACIALFSTPEPRA